MRNSFKWSKERHLEQNGLAIIKTTNAIYARKLLSVRSYVRFLIQPLQRLNYHHEIITHRFIH